MNQRATIGRSFQRRLGMLAASVGLFCAAPVAVMAQNNASPTGVDNANSKAIAVSNPSGVGSSTPVGTAPVPETAAWVAMATLVAAAAFVRRRRRTAN
jgi:MYXO-CTERM domain-containing protein